jgi:hypothetical protein
MAAHRWKDERMSMHKNWQTHSHAFAGGFLQRAKLSHFGSTMLPWYGQKRKRSLYFLCVSSPNCLCVILTGLVVFWSKAAASHTEQSPRFAPISTTWTLKQLNNVFKCFWHIELNTSLHYGTNAFVASVYQKQGCKQPDSFALKSKFQLQKLSFGASVEPKFVPRAGLIPGSERGQKISKDGQGLLFRSAAPALGPCRRDIAIRYFASPDKIRYQFPVREDK